MITLEMGSFARLKNLPNNRGRRRKQQEQKMCNVTPSTPHIYVLIIKEIIKKKLNLIQVFKTYLNTSLSRG